MKKLLFALTSFFFLTPLFAQYKVSGDALEQLAKGKTYFIVTDKELPQAQEFFKVIKETWTVSPIEIINEKEWGQYMIKGNTFFKFNRVVVKEVDLDANFVRNKEMIVPLGANMQVHMSKTGAGVDKKADGVFLDLFSLDEQFVEKYLKKERFYSRHDLNLIARLSISLSGGQMILTDKDFFIHKGISNNWRPGYLKNYLQQIQKAMKEDTSRKMFRQVFDSKLAALKTDTLYIASDIENYMSTKDVKNDLKLLEEYHFPYKLIPADSLSKKILNETKPFYYLVFLHSYPSKFVEVIDSGSGELIYSNKSNSAYIKQRDFKDLNTEIGLK